MSGRGAVRRKKYKFVLLGEGRVGKTSILLRFCKNEFDGRQPPTLNASYMDRKVHIDGTPVQLSIWDTAGQERFHALGPIYYRDADAALLVYDITDAESFVKVQKWVRELRKVVGEDITIAIAGNKIDLEKDRHVNNEEAESYAQSVGAQHFPVSAKLGKGLEDCFVALARKMLASTLERQGAEEETARQEPPPPEQQAARPGNIILLDDPEERQAESGGCCS